MCLCQPAYYIDVKTKKDEDGVEYEWDEEKKAWFPTVSSFIFLHFKCSMCINLNYYWITSYVCFPEPDFYWVTSEVCQL